MIKPKKIAYGAGKKDLDYPNILRIIHADSIIDTQKIHVIETNIDHLGGETLGYLYDKLFEAGARDVTITPTIMKKNRPGHIINVISRKKDIENILTVLFEELGTLGIRISVQDHRGIANREIKTLKIDFNNYSKELSLNKNKKNSYYVRFKIGYLNNKVI